MSTSDQQPTEEELRAAYEAEIKKIRVEQIVLEQVVSLVNIGMRRTGLQPGTEDERDPGQVRVAIEAVRALMPLVEGAAPQQAGAIREALSQMQLAYVRIGGAPADVGAEEAAAGGSQPGGPAGPGAGSAPAGSTPEPGQAPSGPAQRSGRLWVPGQ